MEYKDLVEQTMIESLLWILGICGGVILLLLGIVGYFLKENLGAVYGLTETTEDYKSTNSYTCCLEEIPKNNARTDPYKTIELGI